jgi:hypothetical protein
MSSDRNSPSLRPVSAGEWMFLIFSILVWTGYVVYLGKDTSWDFRNYHWYIPYALLNGRLDIDLLVAHQASYYNPFLDVPFYLLAQHTTSWFAIAVLGAFQAANVVPIYFLARHMLKLPQNRLVSAGIAFFSLTGGLTLSLFGTHYYDNVMSLFIMTSLCILVIRRETLAAGPLKGAFFWCAAGGFLVGASAGLKLPDSPFAVGYMAALLAVGGDRRHLAARLAGGALGGLIGFLLCEGPWMLRMYTLTGNPLFPYFNQYFHSPLALLSPYRDMRFLPTSAFKAWLYPVLFAIDWRVADDLPHNDIRIGIAYVVFFASVLCWLAAGRVGRKWAERTGVLLVCAFAVAAYGFDVRLFFSAHWADVLCVGAIVFLLVGLLTREATPPLADKTAVRVMFVFVAVAYFFWIKLFAIHRYILTLEMMAPLFIAAGVSLLPLSKHVRLLAIIVLFFLAMLFTRSAVMEHAPLGDPYIETDLPPIAQPQRTMVLMTGDSPLGFIAPTLPPQIPIVRIDGWMVQPNDGTALTRAMKARVGAHKGPLFLIADAYDMDRAKDALSQYGLEIDWMNCQLFDTNLIGMYQWCPLYRQAKP